MKNQNKKMQEQDCFEAMLEGTRLVDADFLEMKSEDSVCVVFKAQMTALEVAEVIDALSTIAAELTVTLASACGLCDNCGRENPKPCEDCKGDTVCAMLNGCKDTPAERVANCDLCNDLLSGSDITVPDYLLEEAGIPADAKLEAYADEDTGEITIVEADIQQDISDVPSGVLSVLAASGVCLAELDELIMLEEIVYGRE